MIQALIFVACVLGPGGPEDLRECRTVELEVESATACTAHGQLRIAEWLARQARPMALRGGWACAPGLGA